MKRIISALLCIVMILSLSPVTFAEETYSITVNGVTFMSNEDIPVGKYEGWSYNAEKNVVDLRNYNGGSIYAEGDITVNLFESSINAEKGKDGIFSAGFARVFFHGGSIKGGNSVSDTERAGAAIRAKNINILNESNLIGGDGAIAGYGVDYEESFAIYRDCIIKAGEGEDRHAIHTENGTPLDFINTSFHPASSYEITGNEAEKNIIIKKITITLDLNGGQDYEGNASITEKSYFGDMLFTGRSYEREGYVFIGASKDKNAAFPEYRTCTETFEEDTTVYAVWAKANAGDVVLVHEDHYETLSGDNKILPETTVVNGETVNVYAWDYDTGIGRKDSNGNLYTLVYSAGQVIPEQYNPLALYPEIYECYVFNLLDGSYQGNNALQAYARNGYVAAPSAEMVQGETLAGWATEKGGEVVYKPGESIPVDAGVHQFYAVYKEKVIVTLTVNANGGTFSDGSTQKNDQFQSSDYCPIFAYCFNGMISKDGYILRGFATDKNASVPDYSTNDGFYIGDKDIDLYAIWMKLEPGDIAIFENGESDGKYKLYHNETVVLPKQTDYYGYNQEITGYKTYSNNTTDNSTFTGRWYLPGETISPDSEKGVALFAYTGEYYLYHLGEGLTDTGSKYVVTRHDFSNLKTPYIDGYRGANQIIPPEGKKLVGWATEEGGEAVYKPGEAIEPSDEMRHFYAVYKETRDIVIFDGHEFKFNEMVGRNTYGNWYYQVTNGEGYLYIFNGSYGGIDSPEDIVVYSMGNDVTINADEGKPAVKADGEVRFKGGSVTINGNIEADSVWSNSDMTISGSIRVKNGASFDNSNSTIDAGAGNEPYVSESGTEIASPNATITKTDGKITIAVNPFTIVFDGNGGVNKNGEGRTEWTYTKHNASGGDLQLYDGMFTRDGFTQVGWETLDNVFHSISETFYRIYDTLNIKAVWEALTGVRDVYVFSGSYAFEDGSYYKRLGEDEEIPETLKNGDYSIDIPIWINGGYNWDNGVYVGDFYFAGDTVKAEPGELIKLKPFQMSNMIAYDYTDGTHKSGNKITVSQKWNSAPAADTAIGEKGRMLAGWSLDPKGETVDFAPGASVSMLPDGFNKLYAVWKDDNRQPLGKPSSVDFDVKTFSGTITIPANELHQGILNYALYSIDESGKKSIIDTFRMWLDFSEPDGEDYVLNSMSMATYFEGWLPSGTYSFEAYLDADDIEYRDGETVAYTFEYRAPKVSPQKPEKPVFIRDYKGITLDNLSDYDGNYGIRVGIVQSDGTIRVDSSAFIKDIQHEDLSWVINHTSERNPGYDNVVSFRKLSEDYTVSQNGEWSDWSDPIKVEAVDSDVKNAVLSAVSLPKEPEEKDKQAAVEAIKEIDTEELKKAIEIETSNNVSNGGQGEIVRNIENLEVLTGKTAEKQVAEELSEVIAADEVKVVGAGLNAEDGQQIALKIDKAEKEDVYPTLVNQSVRISIDLVDKNDEGKSVTDGGELAVPVVIKLPIPKSINPSFLTIIHYHDEGTTEKINPTITREWNASSQKMIWYATFVVSSFSDFELVDSAAVRTENGVKVSLPCEGSAVFAAAYDENGKLLGSALLTKDGNEVASGTIICDSGKADTVKFFNTDGSFRPVGNVQVYNVVDA